MTPRRTAVEAAPSATWCIKRGRPLRYLARNPGLACPQHPSPAAPRCGRIGCSFPGSGGHHQFARAWAGLCINYVPFIHVVNNQGLRLSQGQGTHKKLDNNYPIGKLVINPVLMPSQVLSHGFEMRHGDVSAQDDGISLAVQRAQEAPPPHGERRAACFLCRLFLRCSGLRNGHSTRFRRETRTDSDAKREGHT